MTAAELLPRLDGVRTTSRGYVALAPCHPDRNPSFTIAEGERGILLHCWAGCRIEVICESLGIAVSDLFYDNLPPGPRDRRAVPAPRPLTPREWLAASELGLWRGTITREFRALAVLDAARGCDTSGWSDEDFDRAMGAVCGAYDNLRVAAHLHDLAARWREILRAWDSRRSAAA